MNDYINYYDLLGISKNATDEEIKQAYRREAKKWHPDLNKDSKAPEISMKLNQAKEVLLDPEKRKEYDLNIENQTNPQYDNLKKKNNSNTTSNNNTQEKMYTKWEYFKLYLKFYNVSKLEKILSSILIIIETIFCTLLHMINYILALIVVYFGETISYILIRACALFSIVLILSNFIEIPFIANNTFDYIAKILIVISGFIISIIMPYLPNLFINIIPLYISKLNIKLFKLIIGYKD